MTPFQRPLSGLTANRSCPSETTPVLLPWGNRSRQSLPHYRAEQAEPFFFRARSAHVTFSGCGGHRQARARPVPPKPGRNTSRREAPHHPRDALLRARTSQCPPPARPSNTNATSASTGQRARKAVSAPGRARASPRFLPPPGAPRTHTSSPEQLRAPCRTPSAGVTPGWLPIDPIRGWRCAADLAWSVPSAARGGLESALVPNRAHSESGASDAPCGEWFRPIRSRCRRSVGACLPLVRMRASAAPASRAPSRPARAAVMAALLSSAGRLRALCPRLLPLLRQPAAAAARPPAPPR